MAELYIKKREPNKETVREIINKLEKDYNNYIPSDTIVRRKYAQAILDSYREYIERSSKIS